MTVRDELGAMVRETDTVQSLLCGLEAESVKLLSTICAEFEDTGTGVPDHHLNLIGYLGELVLRALCAADLINREAGDRLSICRYRPTEKGLSYYRRLVSENVPDAASD